MQEGASAGSMILGMPREHEMQLNWR